MRAVAAALERGRSAIVLVPEIALTPQTAGRFVDRFGDTVAILHSRLTARERFDEWSRLRRGEARVCVGPRSAIFAPLSDVGLIVVDEEHDSSYKQEGDPRYDARRVAERRAESAGRRAAGGQRHPAAGERAALRAPATCPSAWTAGRCRRSRWSAWPGCEGALHARTHAGARGGAARGREGDRAAEPPRLVELPHLQVVREGLGVPALRRDAGASPGGRPRRVPSLRAFRAGAGRLPRLRVGHAGAPRRGHGAAGRGARAADGTRCRCSAWMPTPWPGRGWARRSSASTPRTPGVLVGTQMVAKGHDFPDVTLGVVLDADATLRFPDFRAEERTFALVAQLAGRSGRGRRGGRVVVQALEPEARALRHAALHDADGFLEGELGRREALGYPPHGHLIRVVCSAPGAGARGRGGLRGGRAGRPVRRVGARPGPAVSAQGLGALPARGEVRRSASRRSSRSGGRSRRCRPPARTRA